MPTLHCGGLSSAPVARQKHLCRARRHGPAPAYDLDFNHWLQGRRKREEAEAKSAGSNQATLPNTFPAPQCPFRRERTLRQDRDLAPRAPSCEQQRRDGEQPRHEPDPYARCPGSTRQQGRDRDADAPIAEPRDQHGDPRVLQPTQHAREHHLGTVGDLKQGRQSQQGRRRTRRSPPRRVRRDRGTGL